MKKLSPLALVLIGLVLGMIIWAKTFPCEETKIEVGKIKTKGKDNVQDIVIEIEEKSNKKKKKRRRREK